MKIGMTVEKLIGLLSEQDGDATVWFDDLLNDDDSDHIGGSAFPVERVTVEETKAGPVVVLR